jgi:RNA polymerase sigma-70 factor, ECF subfamily
MMTKRAFAPRPRLGALGDDDDDGSWLRAFAGDERRALDALFDRYAPRVLALYQHCLANPADSEALLTQTFAQLHRLRRSYVEGTSLRTWLFAIAVRACLPHEPHAAHTANHRLDSPALAAKAPDGPGGQDAARAVRAAITNLPHAQRVLLYLHRFEGMSFGEIAEVLGSNTQEVRLQAVRAYGALHQRLRPLVERGDTP